MTLSKARIQNISDRIEYTLEFLNERYNQAEMRSIGNETFTSEEVMEMIRRLSLHASTIADLLRG